MSDELSQAQDQLGHALDAARAGEDKELGAQVRDAGEMFVRNLVALLRLAHIHSPENNAFDVPTRELASTSRRLDALLGSVQIVTVEGQVYVNDIRVRIDERLGLADELQRALERHRCGGLTFHRPLADAEIRKLLPVLASDASKDNPLTGFRDALAATGLDIVAASGTFRLRFTGDDVPAHAVQDVQKTIARAEGVVTDAWASLASSRAPNPVPIRRLVNDLIDASKVKDDWLSDAEEELLSPTAEAYASHSLRVCSLSLLIGQELGLGEAALADLGVSAVYHDSGYASREDGVPVSFEHHCTGGMHKLLRQRGFHPAKIKRLLATIEHHRELTDRRGKPSLYARIIHIADDFDTYTRRRPGGAIYAPSDALARMSFLAGVAYDPVLLQLFINRVGKYPPGTVLRLEDGRVVVALSGARDKARFARPLCRVLYTADGMSPEEPIEVDLALEGVVSEVIAVNR
jgi:HD superfamily phosphodiesterase